MATTGSRTILIDPSVKSVRASANMASRPESMDGLVVGLLNNGKGNADLILNSVHRMLANRYKIAGVVHYAKGTPGAASLPFKEEVIDDIAERCNLVINALSD